MLSRFNRIALPALPCIAAALSVAPAMAAIEKHWNTAGGTWSVGGNWSPSGIPQAADIVRIGNTVAAENATVHLNGATTIGSLFITDGMRVQCNAAALTVTGSAVLSGRNEINDVHWSSSVRVDQSPAVNDMSVEFLTLEDGANLTIANGANLRVNGHLSIDADSSLYGEGVLTLAYDGSSAFALNGNLQIGVDDLVINQVGSGLIDLDGNIAGDRTINITTAMIDGSNFAALTINGTELTDPMDDDIWVGRNNTLTMNLSEGWAMGSQALLRFSLHGPPAGQASLHGSHLTMHGTITVTGDDGHAHITCPLTLTGGAAVQVAEDAAIVWDGTTVLQDTSISIAEGGLVQVNGPTTVHTAVITTHSTSTTDGVLRLAGTTTWSGDATINGVAQQIGNATVTGPTQIDADAFDLDGNGTTQWSIGNSIVVNADWIESSGANIFDGGLTIGGSFLGRLTVNLSNPNLAWTMAGTLDASGVAAIASTRVEGSPVRITGALNLTNRVGFTAHTTLMPESTTTFATPATELRLAGGGIVHAGATLAGSGMVVNGAGSALVLRDDATLGGVGLENNGTLEVGASPGAAFVDRFTQGAAGLWRVELGGYTPQAQHDLLFVLGGPATLAGTLEVQHLDLGKGLFDPVVGDSFIILRASAGLAGAFANNPVSYGNGKVYLWSVDIGASVVQLQLDETVPCAADLNADGLVNGADLGMLLASWGACPGCAADLTGDDGVNGADLGQLLAAWGPCL